MHIQCKTVQHFCQYKYSSRFTFVIEVLLSFSKRIFTDFHCPENKIVPEFVHLLFSNCVDHCYVMCAYLHASFLLCAFYHKLTSFF